MAICCGQPGASLPRRVALIARQVFTAIRDYLKRAPQAEVWLFPSWLNGSERLQRCFLPNDPRVHLLDFDGFMGGKIAPD